MPADRDVLIAGASGFIGSRLSAFLTGEGYTVTTLGRSRADIVWSPDADNFDAALLSRFDYVINLCGEDIATGRWTETKKHRLFNSRITATHLLSSGLAAHGKPGAVLLNASAIGFYGNRGDELLDEAAAAGDSFLPYLCIQWEDATAAAEAAGHRVVRLRFSIVLDKEGGALKKMLLPFSLGLGGPLGSGKQYVSWISFDDALRAIHHSMISAALAGAVNVCAPQPIPNEIFARELGKTLGKPCGMRMPSFALRLAFGQMADEALLSSTRAYPRRLLETGFSFRHADISSALSAIFA